MKNKYNKLVLILMVVIIVLSFGCGNDSVSKNEQQYITESEEVVYKEMTVNELKREVEDKEKDLQKMDKDKLRQSLQNGILVKENIYFILKDAYLDKVDWKTVSDQLNSYNYAKISILNGNENKSIEVLANREQCEEIKNGFEVGQRIPIKGFCAYKLEYNLNLGEEKLFPAILILEIPNNKVEKMTKIMILTKIMQMIYIEILWI